MRSPYLRVVLGVTLAFFIWYLVFLSDILYSFWYRVAVGSLFLGLYAWRLNEENMLALPDLRSSIIGVLSGALLYAIFLFGFNVFRPLLSSGAENVYQFRTELPIIIPSVLLMFTSFFEEFFWRGYVQRTLAADDKVRGVILTSMLYALIHLPTFNVPLIIAALLAGLAWGTIYELTDSIWIAVFSHIVWTELIFVFLPLI